MYDPIVSIDKGTNNYHCIVDKKISWVGYGLQDTQNEIEQ